MIEGARDCFIISPFGLKKGELQFDKVPVQLGVDFDAVFDRLIAPAVKAAGLNPVRGDKIGGGNLVYNEMFQALAEYPYALVDCTFLNPNVYYELGVRHALNSTVTIAIRAEGASIPFDLQSVKFYPYRLTREGEFADLASDLASVSDHIKSCVTFSRLDSPVHSALVDLKSDWRRGGHVIGRQRTVEFDYAPKPDFKIGFKTGDLRQVTDVDAWVNSENDYMEMSRVIERSVSATIRHLGAQVDRDDDVVRDDIYAQLVRKRGDKPRVKLGTVIDTGPGRLQRTHNVKRIFHVATVRGVVGQGFKIGDAIEQYVENALLAIDRYNTRLGVPKLRSALLPMIGAGQAKATPESVASTLIEGAIAAIERISRRNQSAFRRVYFLVHSTRELHPLIRAFDARVAKGELKSPAGWTAQQEAES